MPESQARAMPVEPSQLCVNPRMSAHGSDANYLRIERHSFQICYFRFSQYYLLFENVKLLDKQRYF